MSDYWKKNCNLIQSNIDAHGQIGQVCPEEIGGYFELELRQGEHYHKDAIKLNTARNCLEYILRTRGYKKIFIPYYTCEAILEPIKKCKIDYEFYHIDTKLEPTKKYELLDSEAFLYTDYFGLKQNIVASLVNSYGKNLIMDNSQAFYAAPPEEIDAFYSARKFFGVADGAYLYTNNFLEENFEQDVSYERMSHLLKRIDLCAEYGFNEFKQNDAILANQPIKKMSKLTAEILKSIDYKNIKETRRRNFNFLHDELKEKNQTTFILGERDVPMVYPFVPEHINLKQKLIQNKIFVATYWPNVLNWCDKNSMEYFLAKNAVFLPVDQRYNLSALNKMIEVIYGS